ncbi:MAG: hypothetical protein JW719_03815 [Pirellulales bacterium]|nr:hypothetical protein [Pirellulales bacterium]
MIRETLRHITEFLTSTQFFLGVLWVGLAAVSITLLVLMRTRWGQSQPLRKCLVLSLLAHLLLAGYATTVQIWSSGPQAAGEPTMQVALTDAPSARDTESTEPSPWDQFAEDALTEPPLPTPAPADAPPTPEPIREEVAPRAVLADSSEVDPLDIPRSEEPKPTPMEPAEHHPALGRRPEGLEAPQPQRREAAPVAVPIERPAEPRPAPAERETPQRDAEVGGPSVLLDSTMPPPSVADETDSSDVGQLMHDLVDRPTAVPSGQPAPASAQPDLPGTATAGDDPANEQPADRPPLAASGSAPANHDVPEIYRARLAPNRSHQAQRQGATPESEAAVREGLKWLAANQELDGRWDASRHGSGREIQIDGQDRGGAGASADTGMTGLTLLAFLAAGHTHQQGDYQDNVRRGLEFLIARQRTDGSMAGEAAVFEAMYCHAMATFAMSEAYGMTGDKRLEWPVRRAIGYTIAAQDSRGGGWRYAPGSAGDTSQLGWQLMALRSAELAGIPAPTATRRGALRFLASVSHGRHGGLASYRPAERDTRPMTAEALVCRQLLGMPPESPTAAEAANFVLGELPGEGRVNLYYWYYSTLGLYQVGGEHFERWNQALQKELVAQQCDEGTLAGSWDPDPVWGSYGGRVYSTALSTLCLEVYYRYLPRYLETAKRNDTVR